MGWKGKIVGKVGNYLSRSLEVPLKHLYSYAAPTGDIRDQNQESQSNTADVDNTSEDAEDEYGPDTSSLTAFLLSLLSSSDSNHLRYGDGPEEGSSNHAGASTSGSWDHCPEDDSIGKQHYVHPERKNGSLNSPTCSSSNNQYHKESPPPSTASLKKLPRLSEESLLLSECNRAFIYSALPTLVKDRHWFLLYSTAKHGISLRTLYRQSSTLPAPFLLVAGDFHGAIFGGLLTAPLRPTSKRKYQGTNDTFVFTTLGGKLKIFKASGANRYYFLCMNDGLSFGGGSHFALHLDEDLLNGSSGSCDTFSNDCLASSMEFSLANVEVWGFVHASRYSSNQTIKDFKI